MAELPQFVEPMLAMLGREPFDSDDYLFEIKWDGLRALTFVESGGYRILGRSTADFTPRYPELDFLANLPPGTLIDGELVVLRDGKPDFHEVMAREQARDPGRIRGLMATHPVAYIAFDLIYRDGASLLKTPLVERRDRLREIVAACGDPRLAFSDGVTGEGLRFYDGIVEQGLEGMVAKRLSSPYRPGRRTESWIKVKPRHSIQCVILGYVAEGNDLRSLVVAADFDGRLEAVGRVGSGLTAQVGQRLLKQLRTLHRDEALIECPETGAFGPSQAPQWVDPELFCSVSFVERNANGGLRAPVFERLLEGS